MNQIQIAADRQGFSAPGLQRLTQALQREIERQRLPGATGLVFRAGQPVWQVALGRQTPAADTPMSESSLFRIFSMTKPLVSLGILLLMEEGRLLLSQPVSDFIAEFANQAVARDRDGRTDLEPVRQPATVQDLLRHTAGLTYEWTGDSSVQKAYTAHNVMDPKRSNAELMATLGRLPLLYQPGSCWDYSRATDVLGRVIEVASGQALGAFLSERICVPLGMTDTAFRIDAAHMPRVAEAFAKDPDSQAEVKLFYPARQLAFESGGGGLLSTLPDYAKFLQMMLAKGALGGRRLVSRKTVEFMTADHLGDIPVRSDLLPPGHGFGLGFAVRRGDGVSAMPGSAGTYHWGGVAGTTFWVDPKEDFFAVLMLQAPNQRDYYRQLFRALVYAALD